MLFFKFCDPVYEKFPYPQKTKKKQYKYFPSNENICSTTPPLYTYETSFVLCKKKTNPTNQLRPIFIYGFRNHFLLFGFWFGLYFLGHGVNFIFG